MLYTYPIAATEQNWISVTLLDALRSALIALSQGNNPPAFQDVISEDYRAEFVRGPIFKELYDEFISQCRLLTPDQCNNVINAIVEQNDFPAVFTATTSCSSIKDSLPEVHKAAKKLFEHAFEKLSAWKTQGYEKTIRALHHERINAHLLRGSCPFCGLEMLDAPHPVLVNPDLDHYLAISKYPFAGVNLRNLTVMGTNCNRSYKGAQDILLNEHNQRVNCMDPYGNEQVTLSLDGTNLFPGEGKGPSWALTFDPELQSRNWRRVFELDTRLKISVLERLYQGWLTDYISYSRETGIDITTNGGALEAVKRFKITCKFETFPTIARLKANYFELIEAQLSDPEGRERMHHFITELNKNNSTLV